MESFATWLNTELETRGWSRSEAARRGGISASMLDKVISENANPGLDFCQGVARAFHIPVERVFRAAGILPPIIIGQDEEQECLDYIRYLNAEERRVVLTLARTLYEERAKYEAK